MAGREWTQRPSWNRMDLDQLDIPDDKLRRFTSIVYQDETNDPLFQATLKVLSAHEKNMKHQVSPEFIKKVVNTVKRRRDDIIAYRELHQEETEEAAQLNRRVLQEMTDDLTLREAVKHLSETDYFLKGADVLKDPKEEEMSKKVIAEILKSIKSLEDDFRMKYQDDQYDDFDMDDLEEITIPKAVITVLPKHPGSKLYENPMKFVTAKVDTGIKTKPKQAPEQQHGEQLSISGVEEIRIEEIDGDAQTYPKIEEMIESTNKEEDEKTEQQEEPPLHVDKILKTLPYKTSDELLGLEHIKPLSTKMSPKVIQIGSKKKRQLPMLEVVALSEYAKNFNKGKEIDDKNLKDDSLRRNEDMIKVEEILNKLSEKEEHQEKEWESIRASGMEHREMRTTNDRRFSYERENYIAEENSRQGSWLMVTPLGNESVPPLCNESEPQFISSELSGGETRSSKRRQESVQKHQQRIANERLGNAMTALLRRTSALPDNLRKQYIDNFLRGGKEGDVYAKIQREQLAQMRRHLKYIARTSFRRASAVDRAEEEVLSAEIKDLEDRLRKSRPSPAIEQEYRRRKLLTTDWDKSKIVQSSEYWRKPPRGKKLVMKEYVRETTFEDILAQRGFFGRKIKREINSIYVPVASYSENTDGRAENEQRKDPTEVKPKSKKRELPGNEVVIDDSGKNITKVKEKESTLQDVNKVKPIELRPFDFEFSPKRGQIRNIESMIKVTKLPKAAAKGGPRNQKPTSDFQKKTCVSQIKPNKPIHRFANKTNKGFFRSFTKVYDISDPIGL